MSRLDAGPAGGLGQIDCIRFVGDDRLRIEHFEDPLEADKRRYEVHPCPGQIGERAVESGEQRGHGYHSADLHPAVDDPARTPPVNACGTKRAYQRQREHEKRAGYGPLHADGRDAVGVRTVLLRLFALTAEQFHQESTGDVEALRHERVHRRVPRHLFASCAFLHLSHPLGDEDEKRHDGERQQRDLPRQADHGRKREEHEQRVGDDRPQRRGERRLCADHVVVQATHQRSGLGAGEERDREALDMVEEGLAGLRDQPFAEAGAKPPDQHPENGRRHGQRDAHDREEVDR